MTDTASACRHDMSEDSTLMLTIPNGPEILRISYLECSVCGLRHAFGVDHRGSSSPSRAVIQYLSVLSSYVKAELSNSSPTDSNSSSPAPIPAAPDTNGREDSPTNSLSSRVSACTSPSMLLKLASGFKGRRLPGVGIAWAAGSIGGGDWQCLQLASMHEARNRMTLHGGKVRLTRSSDGLAVEASLAELDAAAKS